MGASNVEVMRSLVERFNRGEAASLVGILDDYVVWDARQLLVPELQLVYQGTAGVAEFWRGWLPMWESVTSEILWIEGIGDHVLMWLRQTQVGRESGVSVTVDYGWDVTFRHGKIIRVTFFSDEHEGRADLDAR